MGTHVASLRSGKGVFCGRARLATSVMASSRRRGRFLLSSGELFITTNSVLMSSVAVRVGGMYEMPSGAFQWISRDRLVDITNEYAVSGGMTPTGGGAGTTIVRIENKHPNPSTVLIQDEEV